MRRTTVVLFVLALGCSSSDSPPQEVVDTGGVDGSGDTPAGDVSIDTSSSDTNAEASTDTAPKTCASPLDCGDASLFICDPATHTCQPPECDRTTKPCPSGSACSPQVAGVTIGVCTKKCSALGATTGCPDGEVCTFDASSVSGVCTPRGTAALGATCTPTGLDTGCAEGICHKAAATDTTGTCIAMCDPYAATPGCAAGTLCINGACSLAPSDVDPATPETLCTTTFVPCASDGAVPRGRCFKGVGVTVCRAACRTAYTDCPAGFICASTVPGAPTFGLCLPFGVACTDGGSGTCAECRTAEEATTGCCGGLLSACTSTACKAFVDCAMACKRDVPCVDACIAVDPAAAKLGEPGFLCLEGYGNRTGGACGDVCNGPPTCGDNDGPDIASKCTACTAGAGDCQTNGCFGGYYCNRVLAKCVAPTTLGTCP